MGGGFSSQQPKAAAASTMRLHMEANREKTNLSTVKCFVLDNSIRESTTGISRGHTLADRLAIAEAISGCGFKDVVCGYFGTSRKVDDALPEAWVKNGGSLDSLWGFAWYHGGLGDRGIPLPDPCSGLVEMAQTHKIPNAIIEVECNAPSMPYETFDLAEHVERQIRWAMENLPRRAEGALPPRTMIIFGDMGYDRRSAGGMARALEVILEIGRMDPAVRPMGVLCKEPTGFELPESWGANVARIRAAMDDSGWSDGHLLVNVRRGFGLAEAAVLEGLANGATGIWGAVCNAGASVGHAASLVTLTNLARMGNKYVRENYDLPGIRRAAERVHEIASKGPVPRQWEVYGPDALALGFGDSCHDKADEVALMLGQERPVLLSDKSSAKVLEMAVRQRFGAPEKSGWDTRFCAAMELALDSGVKAGQSYNCNTSLGLAALYFRVSCHMPLLMLEAVVCDADATPGSVSSRHPLIVELGTRWNEATGGPAPPAANGSGNTRAVWRGAKGEKDASAAVHTLPDMPARDFMVAVLPPWLSDAQRKAVLSKVDFNGSGTVVWHEFVFWLKWQLMQDGALAYSTPEALLESVSRALLQGSPRLSLPDLPLL